MNLILVSHQSSTRFGLPSHLILAPPHLATFEPLVDLFLDLTRDEMASSRGTRQGECLLPDHFGCWFDEVAAAAVLAFSFGRRRGGGSRRIERDVLWLPRQEQTQKENKENYVERVCVGSGGLQSLSEKLVLFAVRGGTV